MEQSKEYIPATCEHRLPNGFSSWMFQSEESGSGPKFYHDVSICVCSQCGTIRVAGFRQGKDENINRFSEEISIHSAKAIDAIIKYANYIHEGEIWGRVDQGCAALQAKCDRYEAALEKIKDAPCPANERESAIWISVARLTANEALSAEGGEKENKPEGWPNVCHVCGKQDCESDHK